MTTPEEVLAFWFPPGLDADEETHRRQYEWWFRGGADEAIVAHHRSLLEAACRGELDTWARTARGRLALIIVLDQFSRSVWRDTPQAFVQDFAARRLTLEGLERGHCGQLENVWQKTFFVLPLGHAEQQGLLERCVALCEALAQEAPAHLQTIYGFSASQAAATATSSRASAASRIATRCSAGPRPRRSWPTWQPATSCTGAPSRADRRRRVFTLRGWEIRRVVTHGGAFIAARSDGMCRARILHRASISPKKRAVSEPGFGALSCDAIGLEQLLQPTGETPAP